MHKQSNTPLYIVGGCVLVIAIIVAGVRANAPVEESKKSESSLNDFRLSGLGDSPSTGVPAPVASKNAELVQMLPVTVDGKQGLLVRYQADVLFEPIQQQVAANIMQKVQKEADQAGVEIVVIMAVGPGENERSNATSLPLAAPTHTIVYERLMDGTWMPTKEPASLASPSSSSSASAADLTPPAGSKVPLFITH